MKVLFHKHQPASTCCIKPEPTVTKFTIPAASRYNVMADTEIISVPTWNDSEQRHNILKRETAFIAWSRKNIANDQNGFFWLF